MVISAKILQAVLEADVPGDERLMRIPGLFDVEREVRLLECLLNRLCLAAGIKVLEPIDITDKDELFASNMLAFVTVHQHVGLAFLMLKRYKDASRILSEVQYRGAGALRLLPSLASPFPSL